MKSLKDVEIKEATMQLLRIQIILNSSNLPVGTES